MNHNLKLNKNWLNLPVSPLLFETFRDINYSKMSIALRCVYASMQNTKSFLC